MLRLKLNITLLKSRLLTSQVYTKSIKTLIELILNNYWDICFSEPIYLLAYYKSILFRVVLAIKVLFYPTHRRIDFKCVTFEKLKLLRGMKILNLFEKFLFVNNFLKYEINIMK